MTDEMKPVRCGCGGEAWVIMIIPEVYAVECSKCYIRTGSYAPTEAEAIKIWNRAMGERTAKVEVLYRDESVIFGHCECGQAVNTYSNYCPGCGARLEWK